MRGISRLAQELGLSTGTVSRALNGKPAVHEETRRKVLEAAIRLGYEPNQAARTLALGKTRSIGFMIDLDPQVAATGDNFFIGVFDGVQSVLTPHGLDLVVLPCPSSEHRLAYLHRHIGRRMVDGLIISGTEQADPRIDLLQSTGIPFVAFGRSRSDKPFSWVDLDFESVAESAVERLVEQGHRRIAITVPYGDFNFGAIFLDAYRTALARRGIPFDPELVFQTGLVGDDGAFLADALLDRSIPVTAIILIFEAAAVGIYERLAERGLRPGRDLSIIGLRNELIIQHLRPRLTCFDLSLFDVGVALASALLDRMSATQQVRRPPLAQIRIPLVMRPGQSDGPAGALNARTGRRRR